MHQLGKILVIAGAILVIFGLLLWFGGTKFPWFGHLPGDIRIRRENFSFYFPLTSMLLLSVLLSLLVWVIQRIFGR